MSTAFFKKLAAEIDARRHGTGGAPAEAAPAKAGAGRAGPAEVPSGAPPEAPPSPVYAPPHGYPPPPVSAQGGRLQPVSIILLVVLLIVGWYLSGGSAERGAHLLAGQNVSPDFVGAVQLLTILAIGYLLGRSSK
jgi:hypothetical protein